jgi:hypothetical protein
MPAVCPPPPTHTHTPQNNKPAHAPTCEPTPPQRLPGPGCWPAAPGGYQPCTGSPRGRCCPPLHARKPPARTPWVRQGLPPTCWSGHRTMLARHHKHMPWRQPCRTTCWSGHHASHRHHQHMPRRQPGRAPAIMVWSMSTSPIGLVQRVTLAHRASTSASSRSGSGPSLAACGAGHARGCDRQGNGAPGPHNACSHLGRMHASWPSGTTPCPPFPLSRPAASPQGGIPLSRPAAPSFLAPLQSPGRGVVPIQTAMALGCATMPPPPPIPSSHLGVVQLQAAMRHRHGAQVRHDARPLVLQAQPGGLGGRLARRGHGAEGSRHAEVDVHDGAGVQRGHCAVRGRVGEQGAGVAGCEHMTVCCQDGQQSSALPFTYMGQRAGCAAALRLASAQTCRTGFCHAPASPRASQHPLSSQRRPRC